MNNATDKLGSIASILSKPPRKFARVITISISVIAFIAIVFSFFASMDIVVTAQGKVIPSGKSKVIQPLEAGVVKSIKVKDGQSVKAGDVLIELDPKMTEADKQRAQNEYYLASADVSRLEAMMKGKSTVSMEKDMPSNISTYQSSLLFGKMAEQQAKMAAADAEIMKRRADMEATASAVSQLKNSVPLVRKKYEMREELAKTGYISEAGLIDSKLEFLNMEKELAVQQNRLKESEASLKAAMMQRNQALAEFRAKAAAEMVDAIKRKETAAKELEKANVKNELQALKAPIDGVVQQLAVTTVGGVVTQAQQLMTIVPENTPLEVEAQVLNKDIGYVKVGQRVVNKVETFDFTRFGYIEGEVTWVGTDAINDQKLGPVFPVRIRLNTKETPSIVNGNKGIIAAGMTMMSDIKVDKRRLIEYFLSPLLKYKQESMRER
ncbi:MAG: HlyD family type I secretion periplasmic adaptor subunit [Campylobacterales bacterium]|nr:HlyD family type I secretion periplasmic adaptor subunit [Campylobacterales bacterium]